MWLRLSWTRETDHRHDLKLSKTLANIEEHTWVRILSMHSVAGGNAMDLSFLIHKMMIKWSALEMCFMRGKCVWSILHSICQKQVLAALTFWDGPHSVCGMCSSLNKSTSYLSCWLLLELFLWQDIKNLSFIKLRPGMISVKRLWGDFSDGPVAKALCSQCRGPGSSPEQEIRSHMLQLKIPHASTKRDLACCNEDQGS